MVCSLTCQFYTQLNCCTDLNLTKSREVFKLYLSDWFWIIKCICWSKRLPDHVKLWSLLRCAAVKTFGNKISLRTSGQCLCIMLDTVQREDKLLSHRNNIFISSVLSLAASVQLIPILSLFGSVWEHPWPCHRSTLGTRTLSLRLALWNILGSGPRK